MRARTRAKALALPQQSPGLAAYAVTKTAPHGAYLRFRLTDDDRLPTRLVVRPSAVDATAVQDGKHPVRLVVPIGHAHAESLDERAQNDLLERVLREPWWRSQVDDVVIGHTRVPATWGTTFGLYKNAMNPVMTAQLMRAGRMPYVVDDVRGLYLTGSSTRPGQWVSFCAISGVLVADLVLRALR